MTDRDELKAVVEEGVENAFRKMGLHPDEAEEYRKDFNHLRKWRKSVDRVERVGWTAVVTTIVTGVLGLIWLGLSIVLKRPVP